jgi:flagellar biosynthetic protein FliP
MSVGHIIHPTRALAKTEGAPRTRTFWRHVLEMTVAMMLGMGILGVAFREVHLALFGAGFDDAWKRHTELAVFAMTFNMTLPMVLLMRYRGHSWQRGAEMAAAMFGLAFPLVVLFWLGVFSADVVLPLEMALMLPAMVAVMALRFDEYARHPRAGTHARHARR